MSRTISKSAAPEDQLRSFIEKFEPQHQAIIRAARKKLRKRFPTATELVYDNYNFFVIGFGPNDRLPIASSRSQPLPTASVYALFKVSASQIQTKC